MIKTIFLLGHPVGHSISPIFQQVALDYHNLPMVYKPIDVFPDKLEETIDLLRQEDFVGANVTVPHKETVFDLYDLGSSHSFKTGQRGGLLAFPLDWEEEKFSRAQLKELTGGYTVPQIMINNKCIGGYEKLLYLYQNNKLQEILNAK